MVNPIWLCFKAISKLGCRRLTRSTLPQSKSHKWSTSTNSWKVASRTVINWAPSSSRTKELCCQWKAISNWGSRQWQVLSRFHRGNKLRDHLCAANSSGMKSEKRASIRESEALAKTWTRSQAPNRRPATQREASRERPRRSRWLHFWDGYRNESNRSKLKKSSKKRSLRRNWCSHRVRIRSSIKERQKCWMKAQQGKVTNKKEINWNPSRS